MTEQSSSLPKKRWGADSLGQAPNKKHRGRAGGNAAGSCRIHLAEIRDLRSDPQSMGMLQNRPVRATDSISWVRSGFDALSRDSRIGFVDGAAADNTDLVLRVEVINAYVMGITSETRAVSVVLRVRYERGGAMLD